MDRATFKGFINAVRTSATNDPVWYAGYLWLNLTEKQREKTLEALILRGDCQAKRHTNGKFYIFTPSGIGVELNGKERELVEV